MTMPPERICRNCGYWNKMRHGDMTGGCLYVLLEDSMMWLRNETDQLHTTYGFSCAAWQQRESDHDPAA